MPGVTPPLPVAPLPLPNPPQLQSTITPINTSPIQPIPLSPPTNPLPVTSFLATIPPSAPTTTIPNLHPMQTRSKSGITKPNIKLCYNTVLDYTYTEPSSLKITSKYPKWSQLAPKAWFERFTFHLLHLGFSTSLANSSLFIFHSTSTIIYLMLYVDDIIITGNNSKHISHLIAALSVVFDLKDLGSLNYLFR